MNSQILRTMSDGTTEVFVSDIEFYAGMRITPNGDLYVANNGSGTLKRITPSQQFETVMTGVGLNGVEIDARGRVYVVWWSSIARARRCTTSPGVVARVGPKTGCTWCPLGLACSLPTSACAANPTAGRVGKVGGESDPVVA